MTLPFVLACFLQPVGLGRGGCPVAREVKEGQTEGGLPYLSFGEGPLLVALLLADQILCASFYNS